ncbi:MAG: Hsp20/alpha crystallin family protein [Bacteroidetes bacterium]|nr:MAG: Hsp20/alpha crystallin family protein [Bacteroidota bacterium]REK07051.1 MAG: Hsp20/alpha crystallin family protein [Bacteroidota bacterium]REK33603.1 MAG: Hsp20/alpha crystallin family protein [Bacteroidota bacterium]REK48587.1 MAG: Hsp20/alpha crystallin family protein [Bacteroidota bacterium]
MTLVKFKNNKNVGMPYMPSMFSDFFGDFFNEDLAPRSLFRSVPAVNIREDENQFWIEIAAPGMDKKDFKVDVDNGVLSISAERKEENSEEKNSYTRKEFSYSTFSRSFTLPESVNSENIIAKYENGVLMLTLPKKEEARKKQPLEIKIS